MQKRISALLLAMVIVIGSVLGGNTLKVKAASVAVSEEFAVELTMMLYNLLETVAISSGIKDGLDDYESGSSLYDAFIASVESMAEPPFYDTIITQPDGSQVTVKEALDAVESTLGSNALKLPTSETFAKYRVISGTGGNKPDPTPTPSSDPDNTPVPDTGYKDPFTYIQDVLVSSTLLSAMAGIFADLYAGKIEGIDAETFYPNILPNDFLYHLTAVSDTTSSWPSRFVHVYDSLWSDRELCVVKDISDTSSFVSAYTGDTVNCYKYYFLFVTSDKSLATNVVSARVNGYLDRYQGQSYYNRLNYNNSSMSFNCAYKQNLTGNYYVSLDTNMKIFDSIENFISYCETGSLTGLLNGEPYDFPDLATSTAERLQPLTGYEFAPGRLPGINAALSTAAAALPEPGLDPAENTEAYKNALNAALTAALPEPAPEPEPEPDPSPDPGTDGEGESYKRDLRLIFPFCIPFDFIHFIQALSADPVAPCFKIPIKLDSLVIDMVLELDLAWMDPVMEIFRLGELGCFVIMLMATTKKMIGW